MTYTMKMKLRFCESEIGYWACLYTKRQKETNKVREKYLISIKSKVQDCGCLTKDELYELAYWKSHRSAHWICENSDDFVTEITRSAFSANSDWAKLMTLTALQGVKEPTASAILHFYDEEYPILDIHALWSVGLPWTTRTSYPFWLDYIEFCRDTANRNSVSMRELDRALWKFSSDYGKTTYCETKRPR